MINLKHLLTLDMATLGMLKEYRSPTSETSIAKGIPATHDNFVSAHFLSEVMPISVRYRGPRRKSWAGKSVCLKADATTFAIYPRRVYEQWHSAGRIPVVGSR